MNSDDFIGSGSTTLDLALGGYGYACGHTATMNGLPSSCKTGFALEAVISFQKKFPTGPAFYFDAEARLNVDRAAALGVDMNRLTIIRRSKDDSKVYVIGKEKIKASTPNIVAYTVEDLDACTRSVLKQYGDKKCVFVCDSLDSAPAAAEVLTPTGDRTGFKTEKSRVLGEYFRVTKGAIESSGMLNIVLQQLRDNLKAAAQYGGKKYTTSGGHAPDFYRSQGLNLTQLQTIYQVVKGVKYAKAIVLKAKVEKCSIGRPFMTAEFDYIFDYGIDDVGSCAAYLLNTKEIQRLPQALLIDIGLPKKQKKADEGEEESEDDDEDEDSKGDSKETKDAKKANMALLRKQALEIRDRIYELPTEERKKTVALLRQETRNVFYDIQDKLATRWPSKYED